MTAATVARFTVAAGRDVVIDYADGMLVVTGGTRALVIDGDAAAVLALLDRCREAVQPGITAPDDPFLAEGKKCPECGSTDVEWDRPQDSDSSDATCRDCGHQSRWFPDDPATPQQLVAGADAPSNPFSVGDWALHKNGKLDAREVAIVSDDSIWIQLGDTAAGPFLATDYKRLPPPAVDDDSAHDAETDRAVAEHERRPEQ